MLRVSKALCVGALCAAAAFHATAGVVFGLNTTGLQGAVWRWDAAPRTFDDFERSLDGGLRYSVSGGSMQAFRDQFTWSSVPSVLAFQTAVQQAFSAWGAVDPVTQFQPPLSFAYDSATAVAGTSGGGNNYAGAEIDLIATTDAGSWNVGTGGTRAETWISTNGQPVTLTSGVINYVHSQGIVGADIYINSNAGAVYSLDTFRRLLTHEIGHALGFGDVESSISPGLFIDDNFAGVATSVVTLNNSWASLVNPLDPSGSAGLARFNIGTATSTAGVDLLMESNGLGIAAGNPVTSLVPLTNDEYSTRQFLYPMVSAVPELSSFDQALLGLAALLFVARRARRQGEAS